MIAFMFIEMHSETFTATQEYFDFAQHKFLGLTRN